MGSGEGGLEWRDLGCGRCSPGVCGVGSIRECGADVFDRGRTLQMRSKVRSLRWQGKLRRAARMPSATLRWRKARGRRWSRERRILSAAQTLKGASAAGRAWRLLQKDAASRRPYGGAGLVKSRKEPLRMSVPTSWQWGQGVS